MASVCIITSSHDAFNQRIFHKQACSLVEEGYDVSLITFRENREVSKGVEIIPAKNSDTHFGKAIGLRNIYQTAKKESADIYHFHDPGLLPVGAALSYRTDAKVIYDCHEAYGVAFDYYSFPPDIVTPLATRLFPMFESWIVSQLDAVVTANDWDAEKFRKKGHDHVVNVRNFPKTEGITIDDSPIERTHEIQLVYVGGLYETRGLLQMLKLTNRLRELDYDVGLWLLGSLNKESAELKARAFIQKHGLDPHVELLGYIDYEEIFSYLAAADIGLVLRDPGRYHVSIPTKLFEYMYAGIPVIATDTELNRKYLPEQCGTFVPYNDIDEQVNAFERTLEKIGADTREYGRELVKTKYCWEIEQERLFELYESLLNKRN